MNKTIFILLLALFYSSSAKSWPLFFLLLPKFLSNPGYLSFLCKTCPQDEITFYHNDELTKILNDDQLSREQVMEVRSHREPVCKNAIYVDIDTNKRPLPTIDMTDNAFSLIYIDCLDWFPKIPTTQSYIERVLGEFKRILKRGGQIYITADMGAYSLSNGEIKDEFEYHSRIAQALGFEVSYFKTENKLGALLTL